jgi:cytochrome b561
MATERYSTLQKSLHWIIAILILWQFTSHFLIDMQAENSPAQNMLKASHGLSGISILLLMLVRLGVRWRRGVPTLPDAMSPLTRRLAPLTHLSLYGLVFVQTISGFLAGSGLVPPMGVVHGVIALTIAALLALHIAAALWHYRRGDAIGRRMFAGG